MGGSAGTAAITRAGDGGGGTSGRGGNANSGGAAGEAGAGALGGTGGDLAGRGGDAGLEGGEAGTRGDPCPSGGSVWSGDLAVEGDLAELECFTEVTGDLTIELGPDAPLSNHTLRTVGGALRIVGKDTLSSFTLSTLESVGDLVVESTELHGLAWPLLRTVSGNVRIGPCHDGGNARLACKTNPALESISFPALESVGFLMLGDNPQLVSFEAPALRETGNIEIPECDPMDDGDRDLYGEDVCTDLLALATVDLRSLEHADDIHLGSKSFDDCAYGSCGQLPLLKDMLFPALVDATRLTVSDVALERLELPQLVSIEGVDYSSRANTAVRIDLGHLSSVDHIVVRDSPAVISAPSLESVDELVLVGSAHGPPAFPALIEVGRFHLESYDLQTFECASVFPAMPTDEYPFPIGLYGDALVNVDCPLVRKVNELHLGHMQAPRVSLPLLTNAVELSFDNLPELTELSVPALAEAALGLAGVPKLATFEAPALEHVESLYIGGAESLTTLSFPKLSESSGEIMFTGLPMLNDVNLDVLTRTVGFSVTYCGPTTLTLPALTSAGRVMLLSNSNLISFSAPSWGPSDGELDLRDNPVLTMPTLPALTSLTALWIEGNPSISQCDVDAWAVALGAYCRCFDNGTCAP